MLTLGIFVGLILGLAAGGSLANLASVRLRWIWALSLAVIVRFLTEAALTAGVDIVETGCNLGFAGGMNVGIERALAAGATAVVVMNDDVVVEPGWLPPVNFLRLSMRAAHDCFLDRRMSDSPFRRISTSSPSRRS